jgi:hypothetical protein
VEVNVRMTVQDAALRYPIGHFRRAESFTPQERSEALEGIRRLPHQFRSAVATFSEEQLATSYRPGGWTVRQLVHHVADSHMNAYIRIRLGLTEDWPTIVPYQEQLWANLEDAQKAPIATSLDLLDALHLRWVQLLASLAESDWKRGYMHPENGRQTIEQALIIYDWHGRHHTAHVTQLATRMGW